MNKRVVLDIIMVIMMPLLMAYALVGETFHEVAGIVMFVLFLIHHWLNRAWFKGLTKGEYNGERIFRTVLNILLLIFMFAQPITGILMSKHILTSISIASFTATARTIHLVCGYWGFVLLCVHAGTHLFAPMGRLKEKNQKTWQYVTIMWLVDAFYGLFAFNRRGLIDYMTFRKMFANLDANEPKFEFFIDYFSMMMFFMMVGYMLIRLFKMDEYNKKAK